MVEDAWIKLFDTIFHSYFPQRSINHSFETQPLMQHVSIDHVPIQLEAIEYALREDFDSQFGVVLRGKVKWQLVTNEYATPIHEVTIKDLLS